MMYVRDDESKKPRLFMVRRPAIRSITVSVQLSQTPLINRTTFEPNLGAPNNPLGGGTL